MQEQSTKLEHTYRRIHLFFGLMERLQLDDHRRDISNFLAIAAFIHYYEMNRRTIDAEEE